MWIHEHKDWPNSSWESQRVASKLVEIQHRQGRLLGRMEGLGFELKCEANLSTMTNNVVKSSAIEGEHLNPNEVRSSIARRLGINIAGLIPSSRNVEGIVEMMLDATHSFSKPFTKQRLFDWHAALFPTGRNGMHSIVVGNWRKDDNGSMQVVSGPIEHETVHFEAPSAYRLNKEISVFLSWFEAKNNVDPVLKAGIAHLWFVTIHPFEDGNGRIARAIADLALACADNTAYLFYSLSSQFESERKDYYNQLERQQRSSPEITSWLEWFLDCLGRSISNAENTLSKIMFKAQLWNKINQNSVNERQRLIINCMLEDDFTGYMNTSKYAKLAKCSNDTALRDIQNLKGRGIFIQNSNKGRSTSYSVPNNL